MAGIGIGLLVLVLIVVVVAVLIISWFIRGQNNLVHAEELVANSLSQIGVQQASRWDALNALADLTRGYSDQEYKTIMDTIKVYESPQARCHMADHSSWRI